MRSVTVRLDDLRTTVLNLGFVGENEHTQIRIDSKKMFDQYPTASPSLTVCPPEGESYPAVIERDGDFVLWTITDSDLVHEGSGEIQLSFTVSETVAKSYIGRFKVSRSIIATGEIPEGIDDFLTRAGAALTAIPETIDEALAEAKASGEFDGPAGPAGQDGTDGYSPTATVSKSGKTATITITDKHGTTTAQISDGEGGGTSDYSDLENKPQIAGVTLSGNVSLHDLGAAAESDIPDPTSIIDDTAGDGDTDKVWSADKSSSLLTEINSAETTLDNITEYVPITPAYTICRKTANDNYWQVEDDYPTMLAGHKYRLEILTNTTFVESSMQIGTGVAAALMVDTIGTNISFTANVKKIIEYTPSQNGLKWIRVIGNAGKYVKMISYELQKAPKGVEKAQEDIVNLQNDTSGFNNAESLAIKTNKAIEELRKVRNCVDESVSSLLQVHDNNGVTKTITIPSVGVHDRYMLRLGLHYESSQYTPQDDDVFFGEDCRKDFSDVRFFDSNGNIIKAEFGPLINCEILADPNINKAYKVTSQGYIISFDTTLGMLISKNNGASYSAIANTKDVTNHQSDVYHLTSIYPVFVDSNDNIFGYAGGVLYKLSASDDYATITQVLDFSWTNSSNQKVYPDIQLHAMDEDTNGNMIMGTYAGTSYFHLDIFASTDGGNTWTLAYHDYTGQYQHVHHVHADKYTSEVFVGIDDGGDTRPGATILMTDDGGATFSNYGEQYSHIRGKDYLPTYFGTDYKLGGGESYVTGGGTILRIGSGSKIDIPVKGYAGVRSFADFGDDSIIIAGSQTCRLANENHIFVSYDKGKTWESVYKKYQSPNAESGAGYRQAIYAGTLAGDTEPCILLPKDTGNVPSVRIYKGGNHYYREAYLYLENTEDSQIVITAKTGYMMGYPFKCIEENSDANLVYSLPLNEGFGKTVIDSEGNIKTFDGEYTWWSEEEPCRYGDCAGRNTLNPFVPSTGVKLGLNAKLNIGTIPQLTFSKGYTIEFWFNMDGVLLNEGQWTTRNKIVIDFFDIGNIKAAYRNGCFLLIDNSATIEPTMESISDISRMGMQMSSVAYMSSRDWNHCILSVDGSNVLTAYINGNPGSSQSAKAGTWNNLSTGNLVVGADGFIKPYIAGLKIFKYAMSAEQALNQYRGMN